MEKSDPVKYPELRIVELETYTVCNRTCSYCPNSYIKRSPYYMPLEIIEKIIQDLVDMNFIGQFSFHFYNEPLLDKRLPDIIDKVRKNLTASFLLIYTNGDFLTYKYFKKLLNRGVDKFLITQQEQKVTNHNLNWRFEIKGHEKKNCFIKHLNILKSIIQTEGGVFLRYHQYQPH